MRSVVALLGLAVVAAPVAALAQQDLSTAPGDTVISAITPVQLAGLLKAKGYPATPGGLNTDGPWVDSSTNDLNFTINLYGCNGAKAKSCSNLQFRAQFPRKAANNDDLMTQYDRAWVFGKAYTDSEGDMVLELPVNLNGGITLDNLSENLQLWNDVLGDFTKEINW